MRRLAAGRYVTLDGRYEISYEEWVAGGRVRVPDGQQGSECPNGGAGKRAGWTVWDVVVGDHLSGEPFEFATFRDARTYLERHLEEESRIRAQD